MSQTELKGVFRLLVFQFSIQTDSNRILCKLQLFEQMIVNKKMHSEKFDTQKLLKNFEIKLFVFTFKGLNLKKSKSKATCSAINVLFIHVSALQVFLPFAQLNNALIGRSHW